MSTNKKIKTDNNNKIFQDIIDFEILRSLINYLLISKKNKNNNNYNTISQYKISKFYYNRNEILNYILVSKKWYNFISLTISNNIINNKSFEHWLEIYYNNNKSFIENYNNQNQYDKNNLIFRNKEDKNIIRNKYHFYYNLKLYKISFNKEFSIIKIKESIINDYFKFNLFLYVITIDDFKEIKNKFENNQLLYNRIILDIGDDNGVNNGTSLFKIYQYISNENSEIISNLFKILELNYDFWLEDAYTPHYEEEEDDSDDDEGKKKSTGIHFNNLSIDVYNGNEEEEIDKDEEMVKIFKIFKGNNLIFDGSQVDFGSEISTHFNYSALFDPNNSGQQVKSIKVKNKLERVDFVEARHLIKVNQFENLHSITIPINSYQIFSNLSEEIEFHSQIISESGDSDNMKSELNQMINSFITCKSLKNLKISYVDSDDLPTFYYEYGKSNHCITVKNLNKTIESYSNSFQPLFSELNTSIERIELDSRCLLNMNTFPNLLNNKSIKYLYLYNNSDSIVYLPKPIDVSGCQLNKETISINQYLFDNIFSSPLTSIRHYKIKFIQSNQIKFIFNLILNNIFKLQLYSLIFRFKRNIFIREFVLEFKNFINNISTLQQSKNINLKEIKIKFKDVREIDDGEYIQELNNINNPYFTTVIKNFKRLVDKECGPVVEVLPPSPLPSLLSPQILLDLLPVVDGAAWVADGTVEVDDAVLVVYGPAVVDETKLYLW
ncbi:hypothetical protein ACTFIW_011084 [Dictyostelium discoideum]